MQVKNIRWSILQFLTVIKLPVVIKIFILSIFEWPLKTGFTVLCCVLELCLVWIQPRKTGNCPNMLEKLLTRKCM